MNKWNRIDGKNWPENNTKVLITKHVFGSTIVDIAHFTANMHKYDKFDFPNKDEKRPGFIKYDGEYGNYEVRNVIAWMELPEAYREKKIEDPEWSNEG
jgi:hypothetical protein